MTMSFRTVLCLLACAAAWWPAPAAAGDREPQRNRSRDSAQAAGTSGDERRTFAVGDGATLDIANVAGDVRIVAGAGDAIVVEAVRRSRGERRGGAARIEMRQVGNRVEVRTRGSASRRSTGAVDYTVTVPRTAAVLARSVSGGVSLTGVDGEARLESVSGRVEAMRAANVALAKSVSGDVTVRDATAAATLTLTSVSGTVVASGIRGRGLDATTVSGDVRLSDVSASRVFAKAVSGDIDFGGAPAGGGRYEFTAHSGDVRLRLPAGASFDLQADTFSGRLSSDFAVTLRSTRTGRGATRALRGVAGDGAAQLVVRSFSGDVTLTRQ